ncbi:DUF981 family protein [Infirmifilum lucidum]|uniref:DUF981 family protein n=1 Tax=Infirmifilum lucidum TaxID=2776706 RepID=A0A7L9FFW2_9CREN|nr:DUF981 family protein [Infirmifilum lucidum]QOJ78629.1 DUF981 family protein [Infirmifilum lucidum]
MPLLITDPLDTWLMLLGATLLAAATFVYFNFIRPFKELENLNRGYGVFFLVVGVYALATGVWGTITWPMPGPYNIVIMDEWPIFGIACLVLGLALLLRLDFAFTSIPFAFIGILPVVHGAAIIAFRLTKQPEVAGLMYILTGLSVLLSPLLFYKKRREVAWLALVFLVVAGLIALYIGYSAAFEHIPRWAKWRPWYGAVEIP